MSVLTTLEGLGEEIGHGDDQRIRVLPAHVVNHIAAGEVVERPASVVKELLENAIDAKATRIDIYVEDGGLQRIVVSDNGIGMSRRDVMLCLEQHATSKIYTTDDLVRIQTLGFRGEALASVAAIACLGITTRRPQDPVGTRVISRFGELGAPEDIGSALGTVFDIADLFKNTPARRKFMRSPAVELHHCVTVAAQVVLGAPNVDLTFRHGERVLMHVPADKGLEIRFAAALRMPYPELNLWQHHKGPLNIQITVAHPRVSRRDSKSLWFLLNGRYVRDRLLQRAFLQPFAELLPRDRFPVAAVSLEMEQHNVDVNVHPQKLEVRFVDAAGIFHAVQAVSAAMVQARPWEQENHGQRSSLFPLINKRWGSAMGRELSSPYPYRYGHDGALAKTSVLPGDALEKSSPATEEVRPGFGGTKSSSRNAGYFSTCAQRGFVLGRFLLCENTEADALFFIDCPKARLDIALELLHTQMATTGVETVAVAVPLIVHENDGLRPSMARWRPHFDVYGFEVVDMAKGVCAVRRIPRVFAGCDISVLWRALLSCDSADINDVIAILGQTDGLWTSQMFDPAEISQLLAEMDGWAGKRRMSWVYRIDRSAIEKGTPWSGMRIES